MPSSQQQQQSFKEQQEHTNPQNDKQVQFIMGIDEAGRGPVLGPMVYACVFCAVGEAEKRLKTDLHVMDSKVLTKSKRNEIMEQLMGDGQTYGSCVRVVTSEEISSKMLRQNKYNLNMISHDCAAELVQMVMDRLRESQAGVLTQVFVDTIGDPGTYRRKLEAEFPGLQIVVAKKADALYPVVSAASVVAKVTRDGLLEEQARSILGPDANIGSGYPGDAATKGYMERSVDPVFGHNPHFVRISWSTCKNIMDNHCCEVEWSDDEDEDGDDDNGKKRRRWNSTTKSAKRSRPLSSSGRSNVLKWEMLNVYHQWGCQAVLEDEFHT